jgi:hypothetical protein
VVHGATDKSQGEWMRDTMTETARKFTSTQNGKGSRNRTNISSKAWRDGYDNINWRKNDYE